MRTCTAARNIFCHTCIASHVDVDDGFCIEESHILCIPSGKRKKQEVELFFRCPYILIKCQIT
jgi:hypothetical protein